MITKNRIPCDYNGVILSRQLLTQIFAHVTVQSTGFITPCWVWTKLDGSISPPNSYYTIGWKRKYYQAHRLMYSLFVAPILDFTLVADHLCRHRSCINPAHIEIVTQQENVLRGTGEAAKNAKKTHCYKGHPLTPDNLINRKDGLNYRTCKTCCRIANIAVNRRNGRQDKFNRTTCYKGHPYTPENTGYQKGKTTGLVRICRTCNRANQRRRWAAKLKQQPPR